MDYLNSFKSFVNSHYLSDGIKMTVGILLPAFIMGYFDLLPIGLVISIGALCVSGTDNLGPVQHRRIGMTVCNLAIFLSSILVGLTMYSPVLLGVVLFVCCFFFSMLGIYGARATSIGLAALLVMVLKLNHVAQGWDILWSSLYLLAGGTWYMIFSLTLNSVRPYKLAQQALGEYIEQIAEYFMVRASFYEKQINYESIYKNLLHQQIIVQDKQNVLSELLFKTRDIVKESTSRGRVLIMIYLDMADLFESVMTSYQDYNTLHGYFDRTPVLGKFQRLALELANELNQIGLAVKSGTVSDDNPTLWNHIKEAKDEFDDLRKTYLKPDNIEGFISLRGILENIQDIAQRLQTLHHYTTYDRKLLKLPGHKLDYNKFISHQDITPGIFIDNISFQSNIFRHSLRVSVAVLIGYLISLFFKLGHSYWILLTIIVILKPAYSLTKRRNTDRLIGTVCGVLIGVLILYLVKNNTALLSIMILLMAGTYTFIRKHYFVAVLMMTPYIVIFFHLLYPINFSAVLVDRIIDTAIGSVIAFVSSILLIPAWEHLTIKSFMVDMLEQNVRYFKLIAAAFGEPKVIPDPDAEEAGFQEVPSIAKGQHTLARKNALVALANLSDAFNRMLSEPKSKRIGIDKIHQFVVLNHMLVSHIATLFNFRQSNSTTYRSGKFVVVGNDIVQYLNNAVLILQNQPSGAKAIANKDSLRWLNDKTNALLEIRRKELQEGQWETSTKVPLRELKSIVDQFNFIYNIVVDINKVSRELGTGEKEFEV